MIKQSFLSAIVFLSLALYAQTPCAAELSTSAPTQIVIHHAVLKTATGTKHLSIHLIAQDQSNLHENQIYQAHFANTNPQKSQDGRYDEMDEVLFIPKLVQNGSSVYQTTLRLISRKPMAFEVSESTLLSSEPEGNSFFDPRSIHNVGNQSDR